MVYFSKNAYGSSTEYVVSGNAGQVNNIYIYILSWDIFGRSCISFPSLKSQISESLKGEASSIKDICMEGRKHNIFGMPCYD